MLRSAADTSSDWKWSRGNMLPNNMQEVVSGIKPGDQVVSNALALQNTVEKWSNSEINDPPRRRFRTEQSPDGAGVCPDAVCRGSGSIPESSD